MVLGIIREADRTLRESMENHLVGDLKDLGYNAFSAYQEYGPKAFDGMTEEQANKKLAADGIDADGFLHHNIGNDESWYGAKEEPEGSFDHIIF